MAEGADQDVGLEAVRLRPGTDGLGGDVEPAVGLGHATGEGLVAGLDPLDQGARGVGVRWGAMSRRSEGGVDRDGRLPVVAALWLPSTARLPALSQRVWAVPTVAGDEGEELAGGLQGEGRAMSAIDLDDAPQRSEGVEVQQAALRQGVERRLGRRPQTSEAVREQDDELLAFTVNALVAGVGITGEDLGQGEQGLATGAPGAQPGRRLAFPSPEAGRPGPSPPRPGRQRGARPSRRRLPIGVVRASTTGASANPLLA